MWSTYNQVTNHNSKITQAQTKKAPRDAFKFEIQSTLQKSATCVV